MRYCGQMSLGIVASGMKGSGPNQLSEPWWSNVQSKKSRTWPIKRWSSSWRAKETIPLLDRINKEDQFNAKIIIYAQPVGCNLTHIAVFNGAAFNPNRPIYTGGNA